ncbi:SufS family cysteine desulfurase [Alphaproteobacteria bacterium]|nr:SufS family cysteine desulfurase [Alphaproteobacteria bacterium]
MNNIKSDFPILDKKIRDKSITYLDSAASTQKPKQVIHSISEFLENSYENVHRGMNSLSIDATDLYEKSREVAKSFINANSTNEIIFTRGATDSINIIANSLAEHLNKGDKIVVTELEHHSNYLPWMHLCKKLELELKIIPISKEGILSEDEIINNCDDTTKVLSLTHMSNVTGQILDIKKIKQEINKDIYVAVDGCQSIAHLNIDVKDLDCDFYSFSSHKLYGPSGIGIMYGKEDILNQLNPPTLGGGMINEVSSNDFSYAMLPNKFEPGTPSIEAAIGFKAAMEYLNNINYQDYFSKEKKLRATLISALNDFEEIEIYGSNDNGNATSIVSFNIKNQNFNDIATFLDQYGIMIRGGHHCCQPFMKKLSIPGSCRVSFGIYNDINDIDHFVDSMKKTLKLLQ